MASNSNEPRVESSLATSRVLIRDTETDRAVVVTLYGKFRGEMYVSAVTECPRTYGNIPRFIYLVGNGNRFVIPDTRLEVGVDELMRCQLNGYASSSSVFHAKYVKGTPNECKGEVKLVMELSKHVRNGAKEGSTSRFFTVTRDRDSNSGSSPRDRKFAHDKDDSMPKGNNDPNRRNDKLKKKGSTIREKNPNSVSSITPLPINGGGNLDLDMNESVDGTTAVDHPSRRPAPTIGKILVERSSHPPRRGSEGNTSKISNDSIDPTDSISNIDTRGSEPEVSLFDEIINGKIDPLARSNGATAKVRTPYDELYKKAEEGEHTASSLANSDLTDKSIRNKPAPTGVPLDLYTSDFSDWRSYFTSDRFYQEGKRETSWDVRVIPGDWITVNKGDKVNVAVYAESAVKPKAFYTKAVMIRASEGLRTIDGVPLVFVDN